MKEISRDRARYILDQAYQKYELSGSIGVHRYAQEVGVNTEAFCDACEEYVPVVTLDNSELCLVCWSTCNDPASS